MASMKHLNAETQAMFEYLSRVMREAAMKGLAEKLLTSEQIESYTDQEIMNELRSTTTLDLNFLNDSLNGIIRQTILDVTLSVRNNKSLDMTDINARTVELIEHLVRETQPRAEDPGQNNDDRKAGDGSTEFLGLI